MRAQEQPGDAGWRDLSIAEYQQHLKELDAMVAGCQAQRAKATATQTSFDACNPAKVGPDNRVQWSSGAGPATREVRYDWLRAVLGRAAKKDGAAPANALAIVPESKSHAPTGDELLTQARQRLEDDGKQAGAPPETDKNYAAEQKTLSNILAQPAYQGVSVISPRERFLEWFYNWLDKILSSIVRLGSRAPWIAWLLRGLLLIGICTGLIWFLVRIERRSRVRLIPDAAPAAGAPSAREWQLWLKDAQAMAEKGRWREAIHLLYWASIARLESRRLWPADRARTPREYLGLLAGADPRKPNLTALTRSFERTWYGGREAAAADFSAAMELAAALGVAPE